MAEGKAKAGMTEAIIRGCDLKKECVVPGQSCFYVYVATEMNKRVQSKQTGLSPHS